MTNKAIEALIDLLKPSGDILEIHPFASALIQARSPKSHVIIDTKAASLPKATLIRDTWQKALPTLGIFDLILFGRDLADIQSEVSPAARTLASSAIAKEKELRHLIEKEIPQLTQHKYTDADLSAFCKQLPPSQQKDLPRFLHELKQQGQITDVQYEHVLAAHGLSKQESAPPIPVKKSSDLIFTLLQKCLENHMRAGSRFACFIGQSNYEDPQFFERVITNPFLDYKEISLQSDGAALLAMIVEKLE